MAFDAIIIDMFSLYYRKCAQNKLCDDVISKARFMCSYIKDEIQPHLTEDGELYLLYDPISTTSLEIPAPLLDECIKKEIEPTIKRKDVSKKYKKNRKKDHAIMSVLSLVKSYFYQKGEKIYTLIDNNLEADDYVKSIITSLPNKNIALMTTDEDWCRYLSDKVVMIPVSFSQPFGKNEFKEKYQFTPNEGSVCLFKALFGDPSDNISGALAFGHKRKINDLKRMAFDWIKEVGESGLDLKELRKYIERKENIKFEDNSDVSNVVLFYLRNLNFRFNCYDDLLKNLELVSSQCSNHKPFCTNHPYKETIIDDVLGFTQNLVKDKKFKFGNIKV